MAEGPPDRPYSARDRLRRQVRPVTLPARVRNADALRALQAVTARLEAEAGDFARPVTRGDCRWGPRPCPYVSCRYHLFADVTSWGGLKLNFPDLEPGELAHSCALDVADRGGHNHEDVAAMVNIVRERCRQIEAEALRKLEDNPVIMAIAAEDEQGGTR